MLLEIKKEKDKYILMNPPQKAGSHFYIQVEADKIIPRSKKKKTSATKAFAALQALAARYPDNVFLQTSIQLFTPDYETGPDMQDDILLNDALADKYGI